MWLEGLVQLESLNGLLGNRFRDIPVCNIAPQPSTLPRSPHIYIYIFLAESINCIDILLFCVLGNFKLDLKNNFLE
jgi:hypothetical protein